MIRVSVHGAAGRMGLRLMALIAEADDLRLVGAIDRAEDPRLGVQASKLCGQPGLDPIVLQSALSAEEDVVIDFSAPDGMRTILQACVKQEVPLVIGTTGLTEDDDRKIDQAAAHIPILQAPNMSLGVNLLFALAGQVAKRLGDDYDIEIVEAHHRFKKDAPSGTAWGIAEAICNSTGKDVARHIDIGRYDDQRPSNEARPDLTRKRGQIGMHALRMGDVVGEHTACFATLGERLELKHVATDRDIFARGALTAARWLVERPAGRYAMTDVLGI